MRHSTVDFFGMAYYFFPMREIGEVITILNSTYLLVRVNNGQIIRKDQDLMVYGEVDAPESVSSGTGIQKVVFPKGKISLVAHQKDNVYLASILKARSEVRTIYKNSAIAGMASASALSAFKSIMGTPEEVVVPVPLNESAKLNRAQSLGLEVNEAVSVGDKVFREDT